MSSCKVRVGFGFEGFDPFLSFFLACLRNNSDSYIPTKLNFNREKQKHNKKIKKSSHGMCTCTQTRKLSSDTDSY